MKWKIINGVRYLVTDDSDSDDGSGLRCYKCNGPASGAIMTDTEAFHMCTPCMSGRTQEDLDNNPARFVYRPNPTQEVNEVAKDMWTLKLDFKDTDEDGNPCSCGDLDVFR